MPHSHPDRKDSHEDSLFKGIIVGAVVGAGILWLFGTESGKKVKKQIENEGEDILKKVIGHETIEVDEDFIDEIPAPVVASAPQKNTSRPTVKKPAPKTTGKRFFRKSR